MADRHEALVLETIEAYHRGDIEGVLALVTDDIDLRPPSHLLDGVVFRGHAGVRAWAKRAAEMWSEARTSAHLVAAAGNRLVMAIDYELVGRDSGVPVSQRAYTLYEVRSGKIAATIAYADKEAALAQLSTAAA